MDITTLGLAVDSRPVKDAAKALDTLAAAGARAETVAHKVEASFDAEAMAAAVAKGAVTGLTAALDANSTAQRAAEAATRKEEAATRAAAQAAKEATALRDSHVQAYRNQQAAAEKYIGALQSEIAEHGKNRAQLEAMRAAQMGLTAEQQKSAAAMGAQLDAMKASEGQMGGMAKAGAAMGVAMSVAFAVERVSAFSRALFDASAAAQRVQTTLNFATGGNGAKEFQYVSQLANDLGLELNSTAKAYGGFAAAARGTSLEGEGARKVFEAISKASAVMGLTTEQSSGALLALQQMLSKGVVQAEEMRGQLSERLPGAFATAARSMGVTEREFGKLLETGQVIATDFLPKFAAQVVTDLGDAPEKAAERLDASLTKMGNAWERFKQTLGDTGIAANTAHTYSFVADALSGVSEAMLVAKAEGSGFFGQMAAGGVAVAKLGSPLYMLTHGALALGDQLKVAEANYKKLQEQGGEATGDESLRRATISAYELVAQLKEAKRAQDNLLGGAGGGRGSVNPETVGATAVRKAERDADLKAYTEKDIRQTKAQKIAEETTKAQAAAAAMLAKFEGDEIARAQIRKSLETEIANIKDKNKEKKGPHVTAKADAFLTSEAKAYTKAMDDLDKIQLNASASADKLSKTQELLRGIQASPEWAAFSLRKKEEIIMSAALSQAEEDRAAAQKAFEKTRDADIKKTQDSTDADNKKAQALEDEIELWGKSEEAIKSLTIARLKDELAVQMSYGDDTAVKAIEDRIAAITRLATATDKVTGLKSADKAAKDAAAGWERASNKIESDLTNALMRGFESGKGFAENLRDVVVNMFKSMVLEPTLRAVVSPLVGAAQSALGLGGSGLAGSALGPAGGLFGAGFNAGLSAVFGESGTMGGLSGGTAAITAGNITGGLGTLAGAAAPWLAGLSVLKSLASYKVESRGSGLTATLGAAGLPSGSVGVYNEYQQTGGLGGGGTTINRDWSTAGQNVADYMTGVVKASTKSVKAYALALGLAPEAVDSFTKNIEVSIAGLSADQQQAAINDAIAGFTSDMVGAAYGGALDALQRTGETSGATLQRLASDLTGVNAALDSLGLAILPVGINGAATASALVAAFGGMEAMQSSVGAYYNAIYSDAERAAAATENLDKQFAALGLSVPANDAAFRALVEGMDITTTAGQQLAASVIGLAPAFAQASQAAWAAANSMLAAISNWGSSSDLKTAKAAQLQQSLAAGGLSLSLEQIMGATQASALAFYNSLDANSAQAKALLANQQAIFDLVGGKAASAVDASDPASLATARAASGLWGSGGSTGGGGSAGSGAAISAWQTASDAIVSTMKDLQKTLIETGPGSFARVQAKFTIELARARAGDLTALQGLPDLAKSLIESGKTNSKTALDQARLIAQTINSLGSVVTSGNTAMVNAAQAILLAAQPNAIGGGSVDTSGAHDPGAARQSVYGQMYEDKTLAWLGAQNTSGEAANGFDGYEYVNGRWSPVGMQAQSSVLADGSGDVYIDPVTGAIRAHKFGDSDPNMMVPSFDVGTDYVPYDMLAQVHEGERITPREFNPAAGNGVGDSALLAELRALRNAQTETNKALAKISENSRESRFFAGKWDTSGMPPTRATL